MYLGQSFEGCGIPTFGLLKTAWEVTAALESAKAGVRGSRTVAAKSATDAARAKTLTTAEMTEGTSRITCATCTATVLLLSLRMCGCYDGATLYAEARVEATAESFGLRCGMRLF